MTLSLVIATKPRATYDVAIDGESYAVRAPKAYLAMQLAKTAKDSEEDPSLLLDAITSWVGKAFGDRADEVNARLGDNEDDLDVNDIMSLMQKLVEASSEDPTSQSSGTGRSPSKTGGRSTAGQPPKD
jgi:hypothetical protein